MQSVPESRQQSFEEIYGPPENFLEIEVSPYTTPNTKQALYTLVTSIRMESRAHIPPQQTPYIPTSTPSLLPFPTRNR